MRKSSFGKLAPTDATANRGKQRRSTFTTSLTKAGEQSKKKQLFNQGEETSEKQDV